MFLILGAPRSGTTLLASTLDQNDAIIVPHETHLVVPLAFVVNRVTDPAVGRELIEKLILANRTFPLSLAPHLDRDDVAGAVARADYTPVSILNELFATLARKAGKQLAGDKSPDDIYYLPILAAGGLLNGTVKIIHLVRDVRDVIMSFSRCNWVPADFAANFPQPWATHNVLLHRYLKDAADRYHLVRFEDMVADPRRVFQKITDFLGVPFQDKMFDAAARWRKYREMPDLANLKEPFLTERIGAWKREMTPQMSALVEAWAGDGLRYFGYEVH